MEPLEQSQLKKAFELHKIWVDSLGKDGQQITVFNQDLSAVDWTDLTLHDAKLPSCIFHGCDLSQMDMNYSYMGGAVFITCKMTEVRIVKANFILTVFRGCDLARARFFRTRLNGADFRHSDLQEVDLRNTNLNATDFRSADLRKAQFTKAAIEGTQFGKADLRGASGFEECLIESIDISDSTIPEMLEADEARNWLIQKAAE